MNRKKTLLWASAIGILVLLNLWRWLPVLGPGLRIGKSSEGLRLEFPGSSQPEERTVGRDLFIAKAVSVGLPKTRPRVTVHLAPGPTPTAQPTLPDGSVMEAAGGYRLLGLASREGKSQALIGKGSQLFQLQPGDDLEDRYQVQSITENEVHLTDKATGNNLKLHLWEEERAVH